MYVKERLIDFLAYKKMSQKKFAEVVGLSNGYVNAIRKSIQPDTVHKISMCFPELNTGWLLTGEGEMLKPSIQEVHNSHNGSNNSQNGNNNTQINHVNTPCTIDKAIEEIAEQRKLTTKAQEQIDRLLSIIENMSNSLSRNE